MSGILNLNLKYNEKLGNLYLYLNIVGEVFCILNEPKKYKLLFLCKLNSPVGKCDKELKINMENAQYII